MMRERNGMVKMNGKPMTLWGNPVNVGQKAPNFKVLDKNMKEVKLSDYKGKTVVISSVPSLDTPVCDAQTHRFNTEATRMGRDVVILSISMDLPFAQKRWCDSSGVDRVETLSDYRDGEFGESYGLMIKELRLLTRSVIIVDPNGTIRYMQIVPEISQEPNYSEVLEELSVLV